MKKTINYIVALIIGCMAFTSCEDPYANQTVAKPGSYDQLTLQDTTGFAAALKTNVSPLVIQANKLNSSLPLLTCSSVLNLVDTAAQKQYKIQFAKVANFSNFITIPITFDGKAGSDVSVGCKEFNDSIKTFNKNAVQQTVYIRLLSYIVKGGLKSAYTSKTATLLVTPYSYPPTAVNDVASLPMNSSVSIAVLTNDTDPEKDVLSTVSATTPAHGSTVVNANGTITYTPTVGFSGADVFSYTMTDGNGNTASANVDVNVMSIVPYTAVTPRPYYIIGMANGAWNNSAAGIGVSIYPMSVVSGNKYNTAGDGEFSFTGYFSASRGFKLIRDIGSWDEQWGVKDGAFVHNDGGSSDIKVAADGYYTITINSITNTMTMIPTLVTPSSYTQIGLIGAFNGWGGDVVMTAAETTNNHIWYTTQTFTADGGCKFRANGGWTTSWGGNSFPVGMSGGDIPAKAGTYKVLFNDVDGCYYFIKQ